MARISPIRVRLILGLLVVSVVALTPGIVAATPALDPPPPAEARCQATGHGTTCFWELPFERQGDFLTCEEQGFTVQLVAIGTAAYKVTYDEDGVAIQELRRVEFTGTLTNPLTAATIPYEGRFNRLEDFQAGTLTLTGLRIKISQGPDGTAVLFAGREFVDFVTGTVVQAGPNTVDEVCGLLS